MSGGEIIEGIEKVGNEDKIEKNVEESREKIKKWLKDRYNLVFVGVLIFAFILRWYYFVLTKNQPLWWDEAAYGTLAKNFVYHLWDKSDIVIGETLIRPPLFPLIWSILIKIGFNEVVNRFLLEFLPSVISVAFVYFIGKELYNNKIGLIASFIFASLWIHLFYTGRLLTHSLSIAFLFASIYFFIKATEDKIDYKYFVISLILAAFVTLFRYPDGLIYVSYLLFLVLTKRAGLIKLIKEWKVWFSVIIGISPILIFFLINLITKGNIFPALLGGGYVKEVSQKFAFGTLNFIRSYLNPSGNFLSSVIFFLFILGIGISVFEIFLGYGFISKNKKFKGHLLMILMFVVFYSFFIFYIKGAEDRWLFPLSITFVMFSAYGLDYVYEFIKKYNKNFALILVLAILAFGAYNEIKFADLLINEKKETYLQMKQGFDWLKENSGKNSIVIGGGIEPYIIYYAERAYIGFPANESDIEDINAEYLVIHAFNKHPDYVQGYLQNNQDKWQPVNAFFFDEEKKQAAFVIYKRI